MIKGKFSLWLMPPNNISRRLKPFVLRLSKRFASPVFEPHVTLLGRLEGTEAEFRSKASILASRLTPIRIELEEMGYLDEYFRCLFIRVARSRDLLAAYRTAVEIVGIDNQSEFMPHLSLLYADLDNDAKLRAIQDIGTSSQGCFQARCIHLYSTTGSPEKWYCVGQFALGKRDVV
jgi:2'-5' RNA ligase